MIGKIYKCNLRRTSKGNSDIFKWNHKDNKLVKEKKAENTYYYIDTHDNIMERKVRLLAL